MPFTAFTLMLMALLTPKAFTANVREATCEIKPSDLLHCSNIRANSSDYFKSIETMIPKYLQKVKQVRSSFGVEFSHSDLEDFPDHLLQDVNINHLVFFENTFHMFPPDFLMDISSGVEYLSVKDNDLIFFMENKFLDRLPFASTLRTLILTKCNIINLQSYAFRRFTSLEVLDLSSSSILRVGTREFANHPTLKSIDLSDNAIFMLEEEAFISLPNLRSLDLSSNMIFNVHARAFVELGGLRNLNLVDNNIFMLQAETFNEKDLPKLYNLKIADNPLLCDCDLQWFRKWLLKRDMLDDNDAMCFGTTPFSKFDLQCS